MNTFVNPDIAYLLLMTGSVLLMLAIMTPGTNLLEAGALLMLAAAGYEVTWLGFNTWALILLILALAPFLYSTRKPGRAWALGVSILALVLGSLYMFPGTGLWPAVDPVLAVVISVLSAGFLWIAVRKGLQAYGVQPLQDLQNLIGQTGQAKTAVHDGGSVQVASELWSARSVQPIPAGTHIRVVSREGFTLVVECDNQSNK